MIILQGYLQHRLLVYILQHHYFIVTEVSKRLLMYSSHFYSLIPAIDFPRTEFLGKEGKERNSLFIKRKKDLYQKRLQNRRREWC